MKEIPLNNRASRFKKSLLCLLLVCALLLCGNGYAQNAAENPDVTFPDGGSIPSASDMMKTYVINPLDRLTIVVYAGEKQTVEYEKFVQSDGTIYLPFLERDVEVGGMMILDAQKMIEDLARTYIKEPRIVITLMSSYSQSVSTYGRIANRIIELNTPIRVLQLIARAGGPLENAHEDSVRVISKDGSIRYFNYRKVNKNPTNEENFLLKPGDIVFVPGIEDFSVIVFGAVNNSGIYGLQHGQQLLDALVRAGSWVNEADMKNVRILRVGRRNKAEVLKVNMKKIFNDGKTELNYVLRDGDMIYVPLSRTPQLLQLLSTFFGILSTIAYTYTLYRALQD